VITYDEFRLKRGVMFFKFSMLQAESTVPVLEPNMNEFIYITSV